MFYPKKNGLFFEIAKGFLFLGKDHQALIAYHSDVFESKQANFGEENKQTNKQTVHSDWIQM